jgi:hypothetical protein
MTYKKRMIWTSGYAIDVVPVRLRFESTTNATTAAAQPYLGENIYLVDEVSNTYVWSDSLLRYVPEQIDSDGEGLEIRTGADLVALIDQTLGSTAWRTSGGGGGGGQTWDAGATWDSGTFWS